MTQAAEATGVERPVLAVDGKTARRSHDRKNGLGALHSVSVWASEFGLSLGQVACAEKSNEITAIPELLRLVDIKGAIITIDAMGTQKAIAAQIVDGEADYVLALKGNQGTLHQAVIDYIDEQVRERLRRRRTLVGIRPSETGHGREEIRSYIQMPVPDDLPGCELWKGLKSIGVAIVGVRPRRQGDDRDPLLHQQPGGGREAVRPRGPQSLGHREQLPLEPRHDLPRGRIADPGSHLRENFAWLNRFTLSLLKQHPGSDSVAMKRRGCGWSDDFLMEVLTGSTS